MANNWTGEFTKPAPSLYPHQWNWDSGFIAIGYSHYDLDKAETEMRTLFDAQWHHGMVPHINFRPDPEDRYFPGPDFWQTHLAVSSPSGQQTSGITQPPIHGAVLWHMLQQYQDRQRGLDFLAEMFPKVVKLHQYLYTYRDAGQEGLVNIRHPWESGTDNSPTWDTAMQRIDLAKADVPTYERRDLGHGHAEHRPNQRDYDFYVYLLDIYRRHQYEEREVHRECPFRIQDPLTNALLAYSNECLLHIAELLGEPAGELRDWYEATKQRMNDKLWDNERGTYLAWDLYVDEPIALETSSGLIPLLAGIPSPAQAWKIHQRLLSPAFSGPPTQPAYLFPSLNLEDPRLDLKKYWRGPVWINMNWLLFHGLLRYGFDETAAKVKADSLELLMRYGFFEYFNPLKHPPEGETVGYGSHIFSWSAALLIDWMQTAPAVRARLTGRDATEISRV